MTQINGSVEQMSGLTHATAANAEESASAAEEMASQAKLVQDLVREFRLSGARSPSPGEGLRFGREPVRPRAPAMAT